MFIINVLQSTRIITKYGRWRYPHAEIHLSNLTTGQPNMADPTLIQATGTMADIVGGTGAAWIDLIRNIALFSIAPVLYVAGMIVERSRATHQLLQRVTTPTIIEIHERLRLNRLFKEEKSNYNPYEANNGRDLHFDVVVCLNYYEGICSEITSSKWWRGGVWKNLAYDTVATTMIAQRDHVLKILIEETSLEDGSYTYPNLIEVAKAGECYLRKKKRGVVSKIPDKLPD